MEWKVGVSREKLLYCCCLITKSCPTLCDHMDCGSLGSLSMRFPRQKYWSGLPFSSQGDLPDPGIKPASLSTCALAGEFFTTEPSGNTLSYVYISSVQFSSVAQSCPNLCDPMNCSTPGPPVHHQFPEFTQTHVH